MLSAHCHDMWLNVDVITRDSATRSVMIELYPRPEGPPTKRLVLPDVTSVHIEDTEKIGIYDINRVVINDLNRSLVIHGNIPLRMEFGMENPLKAYVEVL